MQLGWNAAPVVHGHDSNGNPITLLHPTPPQSSGGMVLSQCELSAGFAVLGIELSDRPAFRVNTLALRLQHLFEWSGITGFKTITEHERAEGVVVHYSKPDDQIFSIESGLSLNLRPVWSFANQPSRRELEEDLCIIFSAKDEMDLSRCLELLSAVRHLLHFAVLDKVYPLNISCYRDDYGVSFGTDFRQRQIELWNSIIRTRVESEFLPERWVFQFKDVSSDFGSFFKNWLDYIKKFREALGCYVSTIYHRQPDSMEHLSLTQALDAYHGAKFSSHKKGTFRNKIKELVDAQLPHLAGLVSDSDDFAKTVVDNRNYYTHHNPECRKKGRVLEKSDLLRLNEKLKLLFQMCVLSDMRIPSDRFFRLRRQLATTIIDFI